MATETKNTKTFYNTEIPSDWDVKKLGKLGNVVSGLTYSPDDICEETGVLVLRSSNVQGGRITFDDNVFVKVKKGDFNPVKKNDILICVRNGSKSLIGKCALINEDAEGMAFGAFMAIFRGDYNEYLIHVFNTDIYNREIHRNLGATINSINGSDLKEFNIPLPPLPEQKAIAQVLSTADAAIHTTEKLIAQKELRKKWLMQQLLTGKKRLKGFEGEWKEMKLGKIIEICSSKRVLEEDWKTEGVPFFRTREIIKLSNNEELKSPIFITELLFQELKSRYGVPKPNDILVTGVGTIGETYIVKEEDKFYFKDGNVLWFKMNEKVNSYFLTQLFKTVYVRKQLLDNASITTVATFTIEGAKNTKIKLPSLEEQTAIAQVLQAADKEISLLKAKAEKLREQKKGLMQVLLTGKKRLNLNLQD